MTNVGTIDYIRARGHDPYSLMSLYRVIDELRHELERTTKQRDIGNATAHCLIEAGVVPGVNLHCRCDECRQVAIAMDEAGYMDRVRDRWWKDTDHIADARKMVGTKEDS